VIRSNASAREQGLGADVERWLEVQLDGFEDAKPQNRTVSGTELSNDPYGTIARAIARGLIDRPKSA